MIHGLILYRPELLILPHVIHSNQRTHVRIYDHEYEDSLDPEYGCTHEYENVSTSSDNKQEQRSNAADNQKLRSKIEQTQTSHSNNSLEHGYITESTVGTARLGSR